MTISKREISVFIAAGSGATEATLRIVERSTALSSAGTATDGESAIRNIQTSAAEIALIDFELPGISGVKVVEFCSRMRPDMNYVMISGSNETERFRRAMLAGARDFITFPTDLHQLESALERVVQIRTSRPSSKTPVRPGENGDRRLDEKLITFCGAKGGVGASSLVANLALSLADRHDLVQVSILEMSPGVGDMRAIFDIAPRKNLSDLIPVLSELDRSVIKSAATNIRENLDIYCCSAHVSKEPELNDEQVGSILRSFRHEYDLTIVDAGSNMLGCTSRACEVSDLIVIVMTPDILSFRSAERSIAFLTQRGIDLANVQVVVNRGNSSGLSIKRIARHLQVDVIGVVSESQNMREAVDSGRAAAAFETPEAGAEWASLLVKIREKLQLLEKLGPL